MITREQYHDAKDACGDALVLFRMGDYYEAFYDDAMTLSQICGLTVTTRCPHDHVAGFPAHLLESYFRKLIAQGYRAAVCQEQDKMQAAWWLRNDPPPKPQPWRPDPAEKCRQKVLFAGLDCNAGQSDMFCTDGPLAPSD